MLLAFWNWIEKSKRRNNTEGDTIVKHSNLNLKTIKIESFIRKLKLIFNFKLSKIVLLLSPHTYSIKNISCLTDGIFDNSATIEKNHYKKLPLDSMIKFKEKYVGTIFFLYLLTNHNNFYLSIH